MFFFYHKIQSAAAVFGLGEYSRAESSSFCPSPGYITVHEIPQKHHREQLNNCKFISWTEYRRTVAITWRVVLGKVSSIRRVKCLKRIWKESENQKKRYNKKTLWYQKIRTHNEREDSRTVHGESLRSPCHLKRFRFAIIDKSNYPFKNHFWILAHNDNLRCGACHSQDNTSFFGGKLFYFISIILLFCVLSMIRYFIILHRLLSYHFTNLSL